MRALAIAACVLAACTSDVPQAAMEERGSLPIDHPGLDAKNARASRRLSHLQLRRSLPTLLGTVWEENGTNVLFTLAPTLGDPDYTEITTENLDASPLYVKFMEDMANAVCAQAPGNVLEPKATLAENVSVLKLRLHGEYYPPGDPALAPLVTLGNSSGMRAVCIALVSSPELYFY